MEKRRYVKSVVGLENSKSKDTEVIFEKHLKYESANSHQLYIKQLVLFFLKKQLQTK